MKETVDRRPPSRLEEWLEDSAWIAILRLDGRCRVRRANAAAGRLLGAPQDELVGRDLAELFELQGRPEAEGEAPPQPGGLGSAARLAAALSQGPPRELRVRRGDGPGRHALAHLHGWNDPRGGAPALLAVEVAQRRRLEPTLGRMNEDLANLTGEEFLRSLSECLGQVLAVDFTLVCDVEPGDAGQARAVMAWTPEGFVEPFEYPLAGGPCEVTMRDRTCLIPSGLQARFPDHPLVSKLALESYVGIALDDSSGRRIGLLCAMGRGPMSDPDLALASLRLFAARAASELERRRERELLQRRQEQLARHNRTLLELARSFEGEELSGALREIIAAVARAAGVSLAGIWLFDEKRGVLRIQARFPGGLHEDGSELSAEDHPVYFEALLSERFIAAGDAVHDPRTREFAEAYFSKHDVQATLDAPIRRGRRVIGVVCLEHTGSTREWSAEEQQFAASVADSVALGLEAWQLRETESKLLHRNRELSALHRISQIALEASDLDRALQDVLREIEAVTDFPIISLAIYDRERELLSLRAARGLEPSGLRLPCEVPARELLAGIVARTGAPLIERDAHLRSEYHYPALRRLGIRTFVGAPMILEGEVLGAVSLGDPGQRPVDENLIPLLASLANGIATLIGRMQALRQRSALEEQLRQAQKLEAIGTLAGGVAHDFNNLLTGILGHTYLLKHASRPGEEVHEAAEVIEAAADRAAELTRQLLGFARKGKQNNVPVDVHSAVRDVAGLLSRAIDKNIEVVLALEARGFGRQAPRILGDPGQLHQVLLNLGLNARDAMPRGGTLRLATETVEAGRLPLESHPGLARVPTIVIRVSDTGQGIPAEIRQRVFEPFFTTKEPGKGTGMGLAMAYGIVHGHGGAIELDSELGQGTEFRLYLPLVEDDPGTASEPRGAPTHEGGHILLVDDEELVRRSTCAHLERLGYTVELARDGVEAVERYLANPRGIDLVLLDQVMPRMGGRECLRALRRIDAGVPVVLASGWQQSGSPQDALDEGALDFVRKPYEPELLSEVVARALATARGR